MGKRKTNLCFMLEFVRRFIDGEITRFDFEMDFNYEFIKRYDKMCNEDEEAAEFFVYKISDVFDEGEKMDDASFIEELRDGYELVTDIMNGVAF